MKNGNIIKIKEEFDLDLQEIWEKFEKNSNINFFQTFKWQKYWFKKCGNNRKNIIIMLMSIELMLLAINLNLIVYSMYLDDVVGQIYALFILTVAAAESAIGLAILVSYFRVRGTIAVEHVRLMKG